MAMKNIDRLKEMVIRHEHLPNVLEYFLNQMRRKKYSFGKAILVDDPENNQRLCELIDAVKKLAGNEMGAPVPEAIELFFEYPQHHLLHGTFISEQGFKMILIYFLDIETGIAGFTNFSKNFFIRFHMLKNQSKRIH